MEDILIVVSLLSNSALLASLFLLFFDSYFFPFCIVLDPSGLTRIGCDAAAPSTCVQYCTMSLLYMVTRTLL